MSEGIPCPICRMEAMPDGDGYVVCYNCEDAYHANMVHKSRWEVANKELDALRSRVVELERELEIERDANKLLDGVNTNLRTELERYKSIYGGEKPLPEPPPEVE